MFQVKTMSAKDFDFAVRITDQMDWDLSEEDFKLMTELEPEGCFVLFADSKRIGVATTVSFGRVGWFGNLIVNKSYRNSGAGSLLVRHSVKYLGKKGVETIGLFSYMDKVLFYERLGFRYDSDFVVLKGKASSSPANVSLRKARKLDVERIIDFDRSCFYGDRRKLLEPILLNSNNLCYMSTERGLLHGYLVAKVYDETAELGPLVCKHGRSEIAINLLKATLSNLEGSEAFLCISKKEKTILNMLTSSGFHEDFCVARMFLGPPITSKCIYGAESLERG